MILKQTELTNLLVTQLLLTLQMVQTIHLHQVHTNDVISMNGGTTGGDKGSTVTITALEDNVYLVEAVLIGTGTEATPFADS